MYVWAIEDNRRLIRATQSRDVLSWRGDSGIELELNHSFNIRPGMTLMLTPSNIRIRMIMNTKECKRTQVNKMSKTVTLRLKEDVYKIFVEVARAENRSISNLIETAALNKVREKQFVDDAEMAEILSDENLVARITRGSKEAAERKGRFVE